MAPDARRHSGGVDIEASAFPQGAHECVRDLGLALAAEKAGVGMVMRWRRRHRRRIASAAACSSSAAESIAAVWSDQHDIFSLS